MILWFASNNAHKAEELRSVFAQLPNERLRSLTIKLPAEEGIPFDPLEDGDSFAANARLKARALFALVGEPVLADDSGLCVDALGGLPGIYSARYRGRAVDYRAELHAGAPPLSSAERNALLLTEMAGVSCPAARAARSARFVCAMALVCPAGGAGGARDTGNTDTIVHIVEKALEGKLVEKPRGTGGFGYDPLLLLPELGVTVAELSPAQKNALSHRAQAARAIAQYL